MLNQPEMPHRAEPPPTRHARWDWVAATTLATLLVAPVARAQSVESVNRDLVAVEERLRTLNAQQLQQSALRSPTYVEERLTDGELYYRMQDYLRASIIFTDIVENYESHRAYPDALFLLGDSLFNAGDYLGARTRFRQIIDRGNEQPFRPFVQRALGRLIEIAIHIRDFDGVEGYFQRLSQLPSSEVEAHTAYFRAKYLYNRAVPTDEVLASTDDSATARIDTAMLERARLAFDDVPDGSPYHLQAEYFIGVIYTLRGEYPQGIEAFRQVLRGQATTPEQHEVVELTQLALGRLYYETDQLDQAIEAYQSVPRTSAHFDHALFEIAWAYIRLGDSIRAERALEVLAVATPDSHLIPDGKVLRGNLLLRNGRYDDATVVFREVRTEFGPVLRDMDAIRSSHADLPAYFRGLVRNNLDNFDVNDFLPESARTWVNLEGDYERALRVLEDLATARRLIRETDDLITRLNGALASPSPGAVFPDLRRQLEAVTALRNRLAVSRRTLIGIEARRMSNNPELAEVRAQRRRIEEDIGGMPTDESDFVERDDVFHNRYRRLRRELRQLEVELLGMEARITAAEHYTARRMADGAEGAEGASAAVATELTQQRQAIVGYRAQIDELRRLIEIAQLQVGVGDARYARDENLRAEYARLVARERQLGGVNDPEINNAFNRIENMERQLNEREQRIGAVASERISSMRRIIDEESAHLVSYREQLQVLEGETEEVIGAVTHANFLEVRDRFYTLVLEADVGNIDVAWAEREEHRMRVDMLTRERQREMRALDDEFADIMDEGEEEEEEEAQ